MHEPTAKPIERVTPESIERYAAQDRGSAEAYSRYVAAMDASMREKIARTTVHLPASGAVADLGSGSGTGSATLAALYPHLRVVGIDVNPTMVAHASQNYELPNLHFVEGDIRSERFAAGSFSGVFACSVLHHVTSFNNFSLAVLGEALDGIVASLAPGGKLVVRDFVVPEHTRDIFLDVPNTDGKLEGSVAELSTAALFKRFARDFRSSTHPDRGVTYTCMGSPEPGWMRYKLNLRDANEFILRKDYRQSWDVELLEEYTYYTQGDFERELEARGMRVSYAEQILNPWIEEHRYREKLRLSELDGSPIPFPATTIIVAATKVPVGEGVRFEVKEQRRVAEPQYIRMRCYRHRETGQVFELASRPNPIVDIVPWYEERGDLWLMVKTDYPRPILTTNAKPLDGAALAGYVAEPINASVADVVATQIEEVMERRSGIEAASVQGIEHGLTYYPSPGATDQRTASTFVRIDPPQREALAESYSGFSTSGSVKPIEVRQLLRAAAVGALFDSRLEMNAYELLWRKGQSPGPWIGAELKLRGQMGFGDIDRMAVCLYAPSRDCFTEVSRTESSGFYDVIRARFAEMGPLGREVAENTLEYVRPNYFSDNTVSLLPIARLNGRIVVGLEERDLPAGVPHGEGSRILTLPAFRIPKTVTDLTTAQQWCGARLAKDFGERALSFTPLGGRYYPAAGLLPEVVYPFAVEVDVEARHKALQSLSWVPLDTLLTQHDRIHDGHLLTAIFRAAHACGLFEETLNAAKLAG